MLQRVEDSDDRAVFLSALKSIELAVRENTAELRRLRRESAQTVTKEEACTILGVSKWTLMRRVKAGELRMVQHGRAQVFQRRDLDEFIRARRA